MEYFGREASAFTKRMAEGRTVRLEDDPENTNRDGYGRLLRYLWLDDVLLNAEIIAQGYGFVETRFPFTRMEEFRALGREAREAERGLWASERATRSTHAEFPRASPSTIVYVTATGSKYHLEGCRHLSRSMIPMLLESAAARYEPCSICKPPRL